jgi:hypothetical protein
VAKNWGLVGAFAATPQRQRRECRSFYCHLHDGAPHRQQIRAKDIHIDMRRSLCAVQAHQLVRVRSG